MLLWFSVHSAFGFDMLHKVAALRIGTYACPRKAEIRYGIHAVQGNHKPEDFSALDLQRLGVLAFMSFQGKLCIVR